MKEIADIIIVGGGPVGLYGLYNAGLRQMSAILVDSLPELGGQLINLYPEKDVHDVAGVPVIKAKDLVSNLVKQASQFENDIRLQERVLGIHDKDGIFQVVTDKGQLQARSVLVTIGPSAFIPGSIFDVSKEEQEAKGLFIEPSDVSHLGGRRVLICGGKHEAVGWAVEASTVAASVTTITWFDLYQDNIEPALSMVDVMSPFALKEIHSGDTIEAATIVNTDTGEEIRLKVDSVIMSRGQLFNLETVKTWGVEMIDNGIKVDRFMRTSYPGIFAAGDIVVYPGKVRTINAGAGEASIAVNNAKAFIDPSAAVQPDYTEE